jgi:hypothetical protein
MDRNQDGSINDGSELFGSSTTLANGQKAQDGYAALREMDTDGDGAVTAADKQFADLRVWVDSNSDGVSQADELKTLAQLNITKISTQTTADLSKDNGNLVGLTSSYETGDGATHAAADVWFVADKAASEQVAAAPTPEPDLAAQLVFPGTPGATPTPEHQTAAAPAPQDDLRSRVSSLAQAIGAFTGGGNTGDGGGGSTSFDAARVAAAASGSSTTAAVASMADVMKQYDANGKLVAQPGTQAVASLGKAMLHPGLQDPNNHGILSGGGKG